MKITYRVKKEDCKFICLKSFLWDGKEVKPGEEITIKDPPDQDGMVQRGAAWPVDLVDGLIYISLTTFTLPGAKEKFETKAMSLVSPLLKKVRCIFTSSGIVAWFICTSSRESSPSTFLPECIARSCLASKAHRRNTLNPKLRQTGMSSVQPLSPF